MAIEYVDRGSGGSEVVATACPCCDEPLGHNDSLARHIRGGCPEVPQDDA